MGPKFSCLQMTFSSFGKGLLQYQCQKGGVATDQKYSQNKRVKKQFNTKEG